MINGSKESPKKFLAKASSSSRPKTSLPVTGNLAMEIFLGLGLLAACEFRHAKRWGALSVSSDE